MVGDGPVDRISHQERSKTKPRFKFSSITILILIAALLVDSLLSDVSSIVNKSLSESTRIVLFSAILGIAIVSGSHAILHSSRKVKTEIGSTNKALLLVSRIVPIIQYTIIAFLVLITLQLILTSQYLIVFLVSSLVLSWSTGVILMGIMAFKFLQWYRAKRNLLVLLYLVSSIMFCATLGATIVPQTLITLESSPLYVNAHSTEIKPFQANPQALSSLFAIISIANWLVIPLWFIVWSATAVMLSHYSRILGRAKYWLMICAPLVCAIIGDVSWLVFLPSITSIFDEEVIFYTMIAFGGLISGGFLLGFAFIIISKSIHKRTDSKRIKDYLEISAIGVAILFVSFFANPSAASYLPFGVLAASFFGFGSYLYFSGIYSSAISISSDIKARQIIRTSLLDKSSLLDNIGLADLNRDMEKQIESILKKQKETTEEETGIESSISEYEMKNYVKEVLADMQKIREEKTSGKK